MSQRRSGPRRAPAAAGRSLLLALALVLAAAVLAGEAFAAAGMRSQTDAPPPPSVPSAEIPPTPEGYELGGRRAIRIADQVDLVRAQAESAGELVAQPRVTDDLGWEVGFFARDDEVAQVTVDGVTGEVREAWDGYQVAWRMARGYPEQFGHILNAPYVWIPLALAFLLLLFDFRRPFRIAHLDLLVVLSFGISNLLFNAGDIELSVPLAYPPLVYLLARMLWIGVGRRSLGLRPSVPAFALLVATLFLLGFRVAVNIVDSGVIDVGYAGTIGADKLVDGDRLWGEGSFPEDNSFGDTYGPANYLAYVPFEQALPWSGSWDALPSAHAAAIGFDLLAVAGLFFAGRGIGRRRGPPGAAARERGNRIGLVMAFGWTACPWTLYALQSNSNDALVAALLAWTLVVFGSAPARGALTAVAAGVKFAPLPLAPLFAVGERGLADRLRPLRPLRRGGWGEPLAFTLGFAALAAALLSIPAVGEGLGTFYERTIASQLERESPFSIWGQNESLAGIQTAVKIAAAALALALAFFPRRRSLVQIAALSAAILIASQIALDHWFYLYIPWFLVGVLAALAGGPEPREGDDPAADSSTADPERELSVAGRAG